MRRMICACGLAAALGCGGSPAPTKAEKDLAAEQQTEQRAVDEQERQLQKKK
jgi:hypothetical protein